MNDSMHGADLAGYELRVRDALADLPADEVEELIQDLRAHLADVNAEFPEGADEQSLVDRLGPPDRYAAELRAAAGFEPPGIVRPTLRQWLTARYRRLQDHPWPSWVREGAPYVQVGWWVVRGWLLGYAVSMGVTDQDTMSPVPYLKVSAGWLGLVIILASIAASIVVGHVLKKRREQRWVLLMIPVNVLALIGLGVLGFGYHSDYTQYPTSAADFAGDDMLIGPGGTSVSNIYPFDRDGRAITEVYLYDQDGHPISLLRDSCEPSLDYPMDNRFPRPQVLQGFDEVRQEYTDCREDTTVPFTAVIRPVPSPTPTPTPSAAPSPTPSVGR